MIDKLKEAINNCIPELDTIKKEDVIQLIEHHWFDEPKKIQVWADMEDIVPIDLGVFDCITDFSIPIKAFDRDIIISFEEYIND